MMKDGSHGFAEQIDVMAEVDLTYVTRLHQSAELVIATANMVKNAQPLMVAADAAPKTCP
jgi:hypothetical protein